MHYPSNIKAITTKYRIKLDYQINCYLTPLIVKYRTISIANKYFANNLEFTYLHQKL